MEARIVKRSKGRKGKGGEEREKRYGEEKARA